MDIGSQGINIRIFEPDIDRTNDMSRARRLMEMRMLLS